jgi:hypothetical protein
MTRWIESDGGPLVMLARSHADSWRGVMGGDYAEAYATEGYTGVVKRAWGDVVVLNDEPLSTAVIERPEGPAIVRWIHAPEEALLLKVARGFNPKASSNKERLEVRFQPGPYLIMDSARADAFREGIEVIPPPESTHLLTYVVEDADAQVAFVLHGFERSRHG